MRHVAGSATVTDDPIATSAKDEADMAVQGPHIVNYCAVANGARVEPAAARCCNRAIKHKAPKHRVCEVRRALNDVASRKRGFEHRAPARGLLRQKPRTIANDTGTVDRWDRERVRKHIRA